MVPPGLIAGNLDFRELRRRVPAPGQAPKGGDEMSRPPRLAPALHSELPPRGRQSRWIGELQVATPVEDGLILSEADGFTVARLLLRRGHVPLGFIEVPVTDGFVDAPTLSSALAAAPSPPAPTPVAPNPVSGRAPEPVSIVLCTRDRPTALAGALRSLLVLDHPDYEIVVVDNAATTPATDQVVRALADERIRVVAEPRAGLARARNCGVLAARHGIVAFTDDDVVVDRWWLRGLLDGFDADRVACVCGMVPSGELRSWAQTYFDERVAWARSCEPRLFDLAAPPPGEVLFPFQVGQFGTGANFALRRDVLLELGGFDEALGAGAPTRGGEDIDMFVRVLLHGHRLAYQPSAIVWHRHRADPAALREQIEGYGVGLGAWVTKLLLDRRTAPMVARRAIRAVRHAQRMTSSQVEPDPEDRQERGLGRLELLSALTGPYHYARARRRGDRATPLAPPAPRRRGRARA
jgi:GT2 family glycosyltransferase